MDSKRFPNRLPPLVLSLLVFLAPAMAAADLCHFQQVTSASAGFSQAQHSDASGKRVVFESSSDLVGQNAAGRLEAFLFDASNGTIRQLSHDSPGGNTYPSISADGEWVSFQSAANLTGENAGHLEEVFLYDVRHAKLSQVTHSGGVLFAHINGDGSRIAIASGANYVGTNSDGSFEIFYLDRNSARFVQITNSASKNSLFPAINRDGTKIAFYSTANFTGGNADGGSEVFLYSEPSGISQITSNPDTSCVSGIAPPGPLFSANGQLLTLISSCNLLGTNSDKKFEVFSFVPGVGLRQISNASSDAFTGSVSGDGSTISFSTQAAILGPNPEPKSETYLFHTLTGTTERLTDTPYTSLYGALNDDGRLLAFESGADLVGTNADHTLETFRRVCFPDFPSSSWLTVPTLPAFEFQVRITGGGGVVASRQESDCVPETLCISGAVPGRSELFVRVVGPKPNGYLWPNIVKFSTSQIEVWIRQLAGGQIQYYKLPATAADSSDLTGFLDKLGFRP